MANFQKSCLVVTTGTVPADKSYSKVVPIMAKVFCPVGEDDMGLCYGVIGRAFPGIEDDEPLDQYKKIVSDLSRGIDDRREIMTFNHPNLIHRA
jgi:thymidylate synthase